MKKPDNHLAITKNARASLFKTLSKNLGAARLDNERQQSERSLNNELTYRYQPSGEIWSRERCQNELIDNLTAASAEVYVSPAADDIPALIAKIKDQSGLPETIHRGEDELINSLNWQSVGINLSREIPFDDGGAAITKCSAAAAETGTLFLISGRDNPPGLNFLSTTHIALINSETIFRTYEEAFDQIRGAKTPFPRSIMLVSGPSRTADIEQSLTLGAHGPTALIVVLYG